MANPIVERKDFTTYPPLTEGIEPTKIVIEDPKEITPQQKELLEEIIGTEEPQSGTAAEALQYAKHGDKPTKESLDAVNRAIDQVIEDPKILEQRAKQEANEQVSAPADEKKEHFENTEDIKAQIPPKDEKKPTFTHEQLRDALYWILLIFERATMTMVLIKDTGLAVHKMTDLSGDGIYIAARRLEWDSGARHVIDSMAQYSEWTDELVTYVADNGVPVYVQVCEDDYCISSPDIKLYEHEYFKLPNPFERFEEVYGK